MLFDNVMLLLMCLSNVEGGSSFGAQLFFLLLLFNYWGISVPLPECSGGKAVEKEEVGPDKTEAGQGVGWGGGGRRGQMAPGDSN